ncbi:hypothetical protein [Alcanivorax sp. 1008]|uniref:hypothetical protein n=1 Tax=Alcanivorax sp. 1008 TaxID=2816853 RepID=UPI001D33E073|nr:hypothetical protein [Alcanivorax sp. 1008]MCC1496438.1 hypothetical protein [Alcanivorax sp. 1008]
MQNSLLRVTLLALMSAVLLSGCHTRSYLPPDGQMAPSVAPPQELSAYSGSVSSSKIEMMHQSGREERLRKGWNEAAKWFAGDGTDYEVAIDVKKTDGKGGWTFVTYLLTLSLLPYVETNSYESTMELRSGDVVLFSNTDSFAVRESLSVYFPTALLFGAQGPGPLYSITSDQLNRHALALGQFIAESRGAYQAAVQGGTVATYRKYLADNPTSFFRMDALQQLAALAPDRQPLAFHRENLAIDERYARFIPPAHAVWFIGPEGMKVSDVLEKQAGEDIDLLASRIRAAGQPYKVFNDEEVAAMKEGGLKPALIAAMIDASAGQPSASSVAPAAAVPVAVQADPVPAQPADAAAAAPTAGDIAADCAKRLAAMQACDQIPSFGKNICKAQVRKTYDHLVCSVIQ